jgi:succinate dehydrogenase / fumarate reductase cytochrome b subunit
MGWLSRFLKSNMGMKAIMALSGLMLVGFVVIHSLGNLQIFLGKDTLNHYGEMLQGNQEVMWILRSGLILAVVAHIVSAVILTKRSRAARPVPYKMHKRVSESYSARTMRWGGLIVLVFIVFHVLHLTTGTVHPEFAHCKTIGDDFNCYVYENMVAGFEGRWGVVALYLVAQVAIAMHLAHGVWSMFRSLGMNNPRSDAMARKAAIAIATTVGFINCFIPIAVAAGLVTADGLL